MVFPSDKRLSRGRAAVIVCGRTDCRVCVSACGFSAIGSGEGGPFSDPDKCVGCGGCAAICPDGAIRLFRDRGDGSYEVTLPWSGELPGEGSCVNAVLLPGREPVDARVIQAVPKRSGHALLRVAADSSAIRKIK